VEVVERVVDAVHQEDMVRVKVIATAKSTLMKVKTGQ
jgi:hypothetical protein